MALYLLYVLLGIFLLCRAGLCTPGPGTPPYCEQGDPADAFFIVLKGKTEVVIDEEQLTGDMGPEDSPRKATSRPRSEAENKAGGLTKGYGETFGVASLVLDAPVRQYGMRTTERCLFIRIAFDDFK